MSGFTKLWADIITSSIWNENNITRIVWITLLAMSNADGYVSGVPTSVAVLARVTVEDCKKALKILSSPDEESRTKKADGRRIETIEGGWIILNYPEHRERLSDDQKAINARNRQQKHRDKYTKRNVDGEIKKFVPPTVAEVEEYAKSIDWKIDGETFVAYYEARGWKSKGSSIKKWTSAVVTWKKRDMKEHPQSRKVLLS